MFKHFCDRCGKECTNNHAKLDISPNMYGEQSIGFDLLVGDTKVDLCPVCYQSFANWLTSKDDG